VPTKPTLMVASTVYQFEDSLEQICGVLNGFGYDVWNSHLGTIPVDPTLSNLENCVSAVKQCDIFLGITRPSYGSSVAGEVSITHAECREAVRLRKPRWFLVHRDVTLARQLLTPYMFKKDGTRTPFKLRKNPVLDDLRVIELYHEVILNDVPLEQRKGHWVQEFFRIPDALTYLDKQFNDVKRIRQICDGAYKL